MEVVGVHIPDAFFFLVFIVDVPFQGVSPGEGERATSDHESTPEDNCSSLDALLVGHALRDTRSFIQVSLVYADSAADPPFGLQATSMGFYVSFELWDALVALSIVTSRDGALEAFFSVDG